MRYVMDGKLYDTETSEVILIYKTRNLDVFLFSARFTPCDVYLYKTKKGNYFTLKELPDKTIMNVVSEEMVKKILLEHNYDKYTELFGPLEEA